MDTIFKKMNFKNSPLVTVINSPKSFDEHIVAMEGITTFLYDFSDMETTDFILAFCTKQEEVDRVAIEAAKKIIGDGLLWIVYPKGTSKKYKCDFSRDTGWTILGELGFEPVRIIAIDEDWSALRFRRVEYIKKMIRSFAMTEAGKEKIEK
ncbi:MAG: hypothetical protein U5L45_09980 [Saprospiraceae bacterium]|nr:hypothetical protein [Saprospiraceae bacterium]